MTDTVLVTGSEGSLMQAVIPKLLARGYNVVGMDSLERYGEQRGKDYEFIKIDLTRPFLTGPFFKYKPRYIIQGAAKIYGVGGFNKYCADILGDDVTLHRNILNEASRYKEYGVERVVYISSSMVYEQTFDIFVHDTPFGVTEDQINDDDPSGDIIPVTEYGFSKYVGERLSKAYQKQYGIDYTIWRPFNIITPFEKADSLPGFSHVFADFIHNIIDNRLNPLPIFGDGEQVRCFTWIDDIAEAIAEHSFSDKTKNEVFNLGNKEPITMKELANRIYMKYNELWNRKDYPELKFDYRDGYPNDVKLRVPNVMKAKEVLNWEATYNTEYSIDQCVREHLRNLKW